ncbi:hypothetical protein Taro_035824 [Colocasia esculenta]|uniref:Uncharacterized protein n=1 Tax=Colocasia esculenta TaxID=4460 RepID=A0A843WJS9_COLES|nr:hypothetical protein [Colocasia esculenta]
MLQSIQFSDFKEKFLRALLRTKQKSKIISLGTRQWVKATKHEPPPASAMTKRRHDRTTMVRLQKPDQCPLQSRLLLLHPATPMEAAADADTAEKPFPFSPPAPREDDRKEGAEDGEDESSELRRLLMPNPRDLPLTPPSAVEFNFVTYFAIDFMKPGHDQYIHRHANGLCVVGLAPSHVALREDGGVTAVDFNVGKSDRSELKVTGKRKKLRACGGGCWQVLRKRADREGYIAIIMPKPADWIKIKDSFLNAEDYKKLRGLA